MCCFGKAPIPQPPPKLLSGAHPLRSSPLDTLKQGGRWGALCGRTPCAPSSSPASPGPSQHSVPFSASGGHQSLHIARWMLLETKEEDFGCQFVSTSCKVCVEAEEAIYPNQGAHCSGCCDTAGWGLISGPRPEVMGSQILVPETDSA